MVITSVQNTRVKQWMKYHEKKYRDKDKKFMIEGEHLIQEAHQANVISEIITVEGYHHYWNQYPCHCVSKEVMKKLCGSVSGSKIIAICNYITFDKASGKRYILLDDVQDPGNIGTIIRTAHSFGYSSVILSKGCADIYNEKVIRSTQGALFHIPVVRMDLLSVIEDLKNQDIKVYATSLTNATSLSDTISQDEMALVFGNEGKGVSQNILDKCDERIYIEMQAFESLNVAVAAGICMYYYMSK